MFARTVTFEHLWPHTPASRDAHPAAPGAGPPAGTVRLARAAARRLLAALDDRMLRDLDLGWDTIERGGMGGRA
jgi:hypothetical protein